MSASRHQPGPPVALHQPPLSIDKHGIPRVSEHVSLEPHAGLIAHALGPSLDLHAVQPRVAATDVMYSCYAYEINTHSKRLHSGRIFLQLCHTIGKLYNTMHYQS